ncbi:hypothetical protein ACFQ2B_33430 [Streptomyces stramineus]|uniref:Secreted protein n=1 Tax=Streptomyces stramineus TaxID=173861 RepID=A0ABP3K797_9ACTN
MRCSTRRPRVPLAAVAAALALGFLPVGEAAAGDATPRAHGNSPMDDGNWKYIATHHSKRGCEDAGDDGKRAKRWAQYRCLPSGWFGVDPYDLWVR